MKFAGYDFDDKFFVIKSEDIGKHLTNTERTILGRLIEKIKFKREYEEGKENHGHLVVSTDEDYAPEIADIIAKHHDIDEID